MAETAEARATAATRPAAIDCDLHNAVPSIEALFPYLPDHWREYCTQSAFRGPVDSHYPPGAPTSVRPGARLESGRPAGSERALLVRQALDEPGAALGILNCLYAIDSLHNPDTAAALASAVNDWQLAEWLEPEPRLRASIVVPIQQPEMAAREIDRVGGHPGFVQVLLPVHGRVLYGDRHYHPLYAAAARHDLVVGLHAGGAPGNPPTPVGWPSYYAEEVVNQRQIFQSQLMSLVVEGIFDQFPTLRVVLLESGVSWLPTFMWRFDKEWKGLRREVPWTRRPPSAYFREHVRLTIQPFDAPPDRAQLLQIIDMLGADDLLLYASDYPHQHAATPEAGLLDHLPDDLARAILVDNACALYRLEPPRRPGGEGST